MRNVAVLFVSWMIVLGCSSGLMYGQMYKYVDQQTGALVFTNIQPTEREAPELAAQLAAQQKAAEAAGRTRNKTLQTAPSVDIERYNTLIEKYADQHRVDPKLIKAVIRAESNFNERALSSKGAKGLMQLMPGTARRYGVSNTFDPEENIQGGTRYLRFLLDMFNDDVLHAVAAYNAGENAVLRIGGIPPYRETIEYVRRVTHYYGNEKHQVKTETANDLGIYVSRDQEGNILLTNIEPPRARN